MDQYPISHIGDDWDPPKWTSFPGLTLHPVKAAKILGMSANTLKKHSDALGLTVYRHPRTKGRRYDREEIAEVKKAMDEGRVKDILIRNGYGEEEGKRREHRRAV